MGDLLELIERWRLRMLAGLMVRLGEPDIDYLDSRR